MKHCKKLSRANNITISKSCLSCLLNVALTCPILLCGIVNFQKVFSLYGVNMKLLSADIVKKTLGSWVHFSAYI